ncbi:hypothetical protein [Ornithinimicrobium kibberense]|uniref:hypothetical protein n=1 Tax=Ornithinimicrobium kibberense TaxID=282060 RepID=UPI00361BF906
MASRASRICGGTGPPSRASKGSGSSSGRSEGGFWDTSALFLPHGVGRPSLPRRAGGGRPGRVDPALHPRQRRGTARRSDAPRARRPVARPAGSQGGCGMMAP